MYGKLENMKGFYKHKNHRDICYQIIKAYYIPEKDGWKIKFRWWNISGSEAFWMGLPDQTGFISREDRYNWKPYEV